MLLATVTLADDELARGMRLGEAHDLHVDETRIEAAAQDIVLVEVLRPLRKTAQIAPFGLIRDLSYQRALRRSVWAADCYENHVAFATWLLPRDVIDSAHQRSVRNPSSSTPIQLTVISAFTPSLSRSVFG